MPPRTGDEFSEWSEWIWVAQNKLWRAELRDRKGNVKDVQWKKSEPRFSVPLESFQTQKYQELPTSSPSSTVNYAYGEPTVERSNRYPDPSITPTPQQPNLFNIPPASSHISDQFGALTRPSTTYSRRLDLTGPNAQSTYSTPLPGWPATSRNPQIYLNQTPSNESSLLQSQYDRLSEHVTGSGLEPSYRAPPGFPEQSALPHDSAWADAPNYQRVDRTPSVWSIHSDNSVPPEYTASTETSQRYVTSFEVNRTPGNPSSFPGLSQAVDSSRLETIPAPASTSSYLARIPSSIQYDRPGYFPEMTRRRPSSLYPPEPRFESSIDQDEKMISNSPRHDLIDEVSRAMTDSTLTDQTYARSSLERRGVNTSQQQDLIETSGYGSNLPKFGTSGFVVGDDNANKDSMKDIALPSSKPRPSRRSSTARHDTNRGNQQGSYHGQPGNWGSSKYTGHKTAETQKPQQKPQPSTTTRRITTKDDQLLSEPDHPDYRVHKSKHFTKGTVFKIIWSEPYGVSQGTSDTVTRDDITCIGHSKFGAMAYHSTRRFIVAKERNGHSICVPILTYGYQGTNKPGVKPEYHAIVYIGEEEPAPLEGEKAYHRSVRIESNDSRDKLALESRVNYSKTYTVEHNVKVRFIGRIHANSRATFFEDFKLIDQRGMAT